MCVLYICFFSLCVCGVVEYFRFGFQFLGRGRYRKSIISLYYRFFCFFLINISEKLQNVVFGWSCYYYFFLYFIKVIKFSLILLGVKIDGIYIGKLYSKGYIYFDRENVRSILLISYYLFFSFLLCYILLLCLGGGVCGVCGWFLQYVCVVYICV